MGVWFICLGFCPFVLRFGCCICVLVGGCWLFIAGVWYCMWCLGAGCLLLCFGVWYLLRLVLSLVVGVGVLVFG